MLLRIKWVEKEKWEPSKIFRYTCHLQQTMSKSMRVILPSLVEIIEKQFLSEHKNDKHSVSWLSHHYSNFFVILPTKEYKYHYSSTKSPFFPFWVSNVVRHYYEINKQCKGLGMAETSDFHIWLELSNGIVWIMT